MPSQDDASKSAIEINVKLPVDASTARKEETLVIEATIKPMINLVWAGTITLVVGFLLTIMRRSKKPGIRGKSGNPKSKTKPVAERTRRSRLSIQAGPLR